MNHIMELDNYITYYESCKYCAECDKKCTMACDIMKKAQERFEEESMTTSEASLRAQKKYDETHRKYYKTFLVKCNNVTDADVIEYLESHPNKSGTIKAALREYMKGGK